MSLEDKMAFKMVEKIIKHDVRRYEVTILCKKLPRTCLLNSYCDVVRRLHHTPYREATLRENRSV